MTTTLITENPWQVLTDAAKKTEQTSYVAVAYFGQGAAKMLPLKAGSCLVVNASEHTVKSGQTCPADLKELAARGVEIYSTANLHAKIFVFGRTAYIGSTNVSHNSRDNLKEAIVKTTDATTVKAARAFVEGLKIESLGPDVIKRLEKLYKPPKIPKGTPKLASAPVLKIAPVNYRGNLPKEAEGAFEKARQEAEKNLPSPQTHTIEISYWPKNHPFREGDLVMQVLDDGKKRTVFAPGLLHIRNWSNGKKSLAFLCIEVPNKKKVSTAVLAKTLSEDEKRLKRQGVVQKDLAKKILAYWAKKIIAPEDE